MKQPTHLPAEYDHLLQMFKVLDPGERGFIEVEHLKSLLFTEAVVREEDENPEEQEGDEDSPRKESNILCTT